MEVYETKNLIRPEGRGVELRLNQSFLGVLQGAGSGRVGSGRVGSCRVVIPIENYRFYGQKITLTP